MLNRSAGTPRYVVVPTSTGTMPFAHHVGNILNKLEVHSRAQLAAWAVSQGLVHVLADLLADQRPT
jgi:hypothetical protein